MITFDSLRYVHFVNNANKVLRPMIEASEKGEDFVNEVCSTHISAILSVKEVREILDSEELTATDAWLTAFDELYGVEDNELHFDDYPEINPVIEEQESKRVAVAQILALNESLTGFVRTLAFWVNSQNLLSTFVSGTAHLSPDEEIGINPKRIIKGILRDEIDGLIEEDLNDAALFVYHITAQGLED